MILGEIEKEIEIDSKTKEEIDLLRMEDVVIDSLKEETQIWEEIEIVQTQENETEEEIGITNGYRGAGLDLSVDRIQGLEVDNPGMKRNREVDQALEIKEEINT